MTHLTTLSVLALLVGCQAYAQHVEATMPDAGNCGADQALVGQSETVLSVMDFAQDTRIFRSGDRLTMDYRPDRLNIEIGPEGRIVAVTCG